MYKYGYLSIDYIYQCFLINLVFSSLNWAIFDPFYQVINSHIDDT